MRLIAYGFLVALFGAAAGAVLLGMLAVFASVKAAVRIVYSGIDRI